MPTLVAVHAHPDDETITTGGTLARYSAAGVRTVVVTCTRGDLGWLNGVEADDVGELRTRELEAALRTLGVSRLVHLDYLDSGMPGTPENQRVGAFCAAPLDEAAGRLEQVLIQERPDVLIAYDETGGYGHPDHVRAHQVAVAAYRRTATAQPARLYFVRFPVTWSRRFVLALRQAGIDAPWSAVSGADAGPDAELIGVPDELVTTAVDVHGYVETKRAALACHRSQMPPWHFLMRMPDALAHELWANEFFSLENGRVAAPRTDLFGDSSSR
ncbi:MAG: PIG-L family deacetylase [Chloroflexi bacterium]|nr:PIG-L family deacetylase [Chloroflexota bacterium]